jgi:hypothetical protein
MAQVVSGEPIAMVAWVPSKTILFGIYDGQGWSEMGFPGVLQFSSVAVIPLMVRTHESPVLDDFGNW